MPKVILNKGKGKTVKEVAGFDAGKMEILKMGPRISSVFIRLTFILWR